MGAGQRRLVPVRAEDEVVGPVGVRPLVEHDRHVGLRRPRRQDERALGEELGQQRRRREPREGRVRLGPPEVRRVERVVLLEEPGVRDGDDELHAALGQLAERRERGARVGEVLEALEADDRVERLRRLL